MYNGGLILAPYVSSNLKILLLCMVPFDLLTCLSDKFTSDHHILTALKTFHNTVTVRSCHLLPRGAHFEFNLIQQYINSGVETP